MHEGLTVNLSVRYRIFVFPFFELRNLVFMPVNLKYVTMPIYVICRKPQINAQLVAQQVATQQFALPPVKKEKYAWVCLTSQIKQC